MSNKLIVSLSFLTAALIAINCGTDADTSKGIHYITSSKTRVEPNLPPDTLNKQVQANTRFALNLRKEISFNNENTLIAPYSISSALAMTYAGSTHNNKIQMKDALQFDLNDNELHEAFNQLDQSLAQSSTDKTKLEITNALWGEKNISFKDPYLDILAMHYGAGIYSLSFIEDPEGARQIINDWVSDKTNQRIKDLIPPKMLDEETRFVLTNTIYFKGQWAEDFEKNLTYSAPFKLNDDKSIDVDMMTGEKHGTLALSNDEYDAVELRYKDSSIRMQIIMPKSQSLAQFIQSLDEERLDAISSSLQYQQVVKVELPRFEFNAKYLLSQMLQKLGMIDAFNDMDPSLFEDISTNSTYIKEVIHQTYIAVDEEGTEAAGATAVVGADASVSMPTDPTLHLVFDQPFLFVLRDSKTQSVLFMGELYDPSK